MRLSKTYSKVRIRKNLSNAFPIQNDLKQGDALSPLLINFISEYAIRKDWKSMDHISYWFTMIMLMQWAKM